MITATDLIRLATWLSPGFPVGAFSYSHGLEQAVEAGQIIDAETLALWIGGILAFGGGRLDAALFRTAHEAASDGEDRRLAWVTAQAEARRGTAEMALESSAQGRAFLETLRKVWPHPRLDAWWKELETTGREPSYPVAVGVACAVHGLPLRPALTVYLHAFAANLVSAAVRLIPLGQTDGQRVLARSETAVITTVEAVLTGPDDDFATASLAVDFLSIKHETQYTRLFRS